MTISSNLTAAQVKTARKFIEGIPKDSKNTMLETCLSMESANKITNDFARDLITATDIPGFMTNVQTAEQNELTMLSFHEQTPEKQNEITKLLLSPGEQQQKAGALIMLAANNPVGYLKAARSLAYSTTTTNGDVRSEDFVMMHADAAGVDNEDLAMLSFDQHELMAMLPYSVVFNVKASRLSDMGEELYTTITLAPNQIGYDVSFRRPLVFNHVKRNSDGTMADWTKRPLLDGFMYNDVLDNETTDLNPIYRTDGSNAQFFVDTTIVAPTDFDWKGVTYETSYLAVDQTIDAVGIAETDDILANGYSDNTDALDAQITLTNLLLKVTSAANGESYIDADVSGLIYNNFQKSLEGDFRKMVLNFDTHSIQMDDKTVDVEGVPAVALKDLQDSKGAIQIAINVSGTTNVEKAAMRVNRSTGELYRAVDQGDQELTAKSDDFKALADDLTFELVGYKTIVRRNNANRRERGKHLDFNMKQERYPIAMLAPYSIPRPLDWEENAADLDVLIQACNIRFDNMMINKLLAYQKQLKSVATSRFSSFGDIQIEGFGRYLIRPWYDATELDLEEVVQGTSTAERRKEVSDGIMNVVREMAYRMYSESGYQPALRLLSSNANEKPRCVVATDNYIPQFLQTEGDFRSAGITFDFVVKDNPNVLLRDQLFVTLSRGIKNNPDPLTFGMFLYVPELVSVAQVARNGTQNKETMVQPRCRFVNNCPMLGVITLKNLRKVYTKAIKLPISVKDMPEATDDGGDTPDDGGNGGA